MSQVAARAEPTLRTTFAPLEEPRFVYTRDIPDGLFVVGFTGIGYPDGAELDSKKGFIILHASEGDGQIFVEDMNSFEWVAAKLWAKPWKIGQTPSGPPFGSTC